MIEQTLAIIKPDAVSRGLIGKILARIEEQGFRVRALRMVQLSKQTAQAFYQVHAERPFYESLTTYMSSGPVVPMLLERENAIQSLRELMGATNPATGRSWHNPSRLRREYRAQCHPWLRCCGHCLRGDRLLF